MNREDERLARSVGMCPQEMRRCVEDAQDITNRYGLRHMQAAQQDDRLSVKKVTDTDNDVYPILKRPSQQRLEM